MWLLDYLLLALFHVIWVAKCCPLVFCNLLVGMKACHVDITWFFPKLHCSTLTLLTETSLLVLQTEKKVHLDYHTSMFNFIHKTSIIDFHTQYVSRKSIRNHNNEYTSSLHEPCRNVRLPLPLDPHQSVNSFHSDFSSTSSGVTEL